MSYFEIDDPKGNWDEIYRNIKQIQEANVREFCDQIYEHIAHGDDNHRKWLKDKLEECYNRWLNI